MTYAEKLKNPKWQKRRLEILQRDQFKCTKCGDDLNTLHVHHKAYNANPWDATDEMLETLCEGCHLYIEEWKKVDIDIVSDAALRAGSTNQVKFYFALADDGRVYVIRVADGELTTLLNLSKEMFDHVYEQINSGLSNG